MSDLLHVLVISGWAITLVLGLVLLLHTLKLRKRLKVSPGGKTAGDDSGDDTKKELFYQLGDLMPDWIYIKDTESRFIYANRHLAAIHGIDEPRSMKGKSDFDYYPKPVAQRFFEDEQEIIRSGNPIINQEKSIKDPQGKEIILSTTKMPLRDRKGHVAGIAGIGRDVTRQKDDRERLHQLSVVASATDNVVVIMDAQGEFTWVNRCFEDRYGLDMEAFIREQGSNLQDNSSNPRIGEILDEVVNSKVARTYTTRTQDKKGKDVWYQTHITPILDDKEQVSSLFLIDVDISSIKKADLMIKQQKYELEHQRDQLKKLNASKDQLFSIIAHDLKNPFQAIIGFAELLKEDHREMAEEQVEEYLDAIHQSSTSAYDLLFNLLQWARTQTGSVKVHPVDVGVHKLTAKVLDLFSAPTTDKKIRIKNEVPEEIRVRSDKDMLHTVLRNLLGNAIKYTYEEGTITLSAKSLEEEVEISVQDTGQGMTEAQLKALFTVDKAVSTPGTSGEQGTGLGLMVCHEFLSMNQGAIRVHSESGKGSTFTISLPKST